MNAKIVSKKNSHTNVATTEKVWRAGCLKNADFVAILKDCAKRRDLTRGRKIHEHILKEGLVHKDIYIGSSLISLYVKCDKISKAQEVFDELPIRNVVSWTALITGYGQQGEVENVLQLFDRMRRDGKKPNSITFLSVLNACSHAGLVDKGQEYFRIMVEAYGLNPSLEHHTCLIDLLGRSGQLYKAVEIMKKTMTCPHIEMWLTILGACRKWGDVELGRKVIQMDEHEVSAYICMNNIYVDAGMHEDANKIDEMRVKKCIKEDLTVD